MKQQHFVDNFDISGIYSHERTMHLDVSSIPHEDDLIEDDVLMHQLTVLQGINSTNFKEIQKSSSEDHLLETARDLKRKVIKTLELYSQLIAKKDGSIKERIPKDISEITAKYNEISSMNGQGQEFQAIIHLVGEFVSKMSIRTQVKARTQPPCHKSQSYESDESTSLPNKTLTAVNNKIKQLIGQLGKEHSNIVTLSESILSSTEHADTFKQLRIESKNTTSEVVNKLVKACYLKLKMQEHGQSTYKREFYDMVIKMKSTAPADHEAHKVMISYLYEDCVVQQGLSTSEWESYMKSKLKL